MQHLFSYNLLVDDVLDEQTARDLVDELLAAGVTCVVTGGFPRTYERLVEAARARGVRVLATWHGSFMQIGEAYDHASMVAMLDRARAGDIERVGFVKAGMAETYARHGVPAATLLNYVRTPPAAATSGTMGERPSLGIWSVAPVWRKIPYAMVAACADVEPRPRLWVTGNDPALLALARELEVDVHPIGGAVPQDEMPTWLASMDLNLYVTLSECAPMLPLESLAVGVPCLLGPNSHYFDNDAFLRDRLVVDEPDRHDSIARTISRALDDREAVVEYFRSSFYPAYAVAARGSVLAFVGAPEGAEL